MKATRSVSPSRFNVALPLLAALTLLTAGSVYATDRIWQGGSSVWSDTSAIGWNGVVPASGDNAWVTNAAACTVTNDAANQLSSRFVRLGRSVTLDTGNFFQNQLSYLDFTSGGTLRLSRTSHFQNYGTCIFPNNFTLFTTGTGSTATITNTLAGADNFINLGYTNSTLTFSLAGSSTMNVYAPLANGTDSGTGTSNYVSGINVGTGGTVVLGAVNTYTGPTAIGSGGALIIAGAGSLGSGSYAGNITNAGTFTYNSTAAQTLSGTISGGGTFVKTNTSTLTLAASNSYSGGTTIGGGTLKIDAGAGGTNSSSSALTFYDSGTFNYDNTTASAAKSQNMGALNAFGGEATVQLTRTASQTVSNYFSSWGGRAAGAALNLVKAGTPGVNGTDSSIVINGVSAGIFSKGVYFNGADFAYANAANGYIRAPVYGTDSGYASVTTLTGNTLTHNLLTASCSFAGGSFWKSTKINSASAIDITISSSIWYWSGSSFGQLLRTGGGSTTISGPGTIQPAAGGDLAFRTDTASDTITVNAVIADNGTTTLTKSGAGTLTLNATNTYTGTTYVDAGTLLINNNQTSTGAITVYNGGTLGGSGTISNTVTINNGGTLQPSISGSVSTLTLGSATAPTLSAGSSLKIRVPTSSTADKVLLSSTTPAFTATGVNLVIDATGFSGSASGLTIVQVAKTSSGIVGTFNSITVTGVSGYNATPHYNTQTITLDVAPSVGAVDASHSTISPATATKTADGSSTQVITVQARDVNNNNRVTGGDTVVFSATAGTVGSTTDNGNGTYTATWTAPTSVGSGTATVTATLGGTAVGTAVSASSSVITLQAGALDHFNISSISSPQTVGVPITGITITAKDVNNNTVTSYTTNVTYSGTAGITGTSANFTAGVLSGVSVTPQSSGSSLTFIVTGTGSKTGTATFDVNPSPVDHFAISTISSPQTAGGAITGITITAQDTNNATVTSYIGNVTFGGTAGITGTSASFTAGMLTGVSVTPTSAGSGKTFTVTSGTATGSATFDVNPAALDHFAISSISSPQTAGTAITGITLTAQDVYNNTVSSFASTVAYSGTAGITGTSAAFTSGQLTGVSVTPTSAGSSKTFIVTGSSKTGTATFNVNPGAAHHLTITSSTADLGSGTVRSITAEVRDANENVVTTDNSTSVNFAQTSGSGSVTGTGSTTAASGIATKSVTGGTPGSVTLTTSSGSLTSATTSFNVVAGSVSASASTVSASPTTVLANGGTKSTVTVTLKDASNNLISGKTVTLAKTSGTGTPTITTVQGTTDGSGVALFTVKSSTAATFVFTATDSTDSTTITQTASVTFTTSGTSSNPQWSGGAGADGNFSTVSNWTNNMAPIDGGKLYFTNNYSTTSITNDLVSGTTPSGMKLGINFTANAPAYTVYGNPMMMDVFGGFNNASANIQTLNAPLFVQSVGVIVSLNCGTPGTVFNSLATPDTNTTTAFNLAGGNATVVNNQMIGGMQISGATLSIGSIANGGVNPSVSVTNVAGANTITFATGTAMDNLKVGQVVALQPTSASSVLPLPVGTVVTALATNGSIITATLSANSVAGFTNNVGVWFGTPNALGISSSASGNLWFNGLNATLQYNGSTASSDRNFQIAAAYTSYISVTNPTTVLTMSGNSYTVGGAGNVASFAKSGAGTLILTGTHTNIGATTVTSGALLVNSPGSLGVTAVTVQTNATFGGTGTAGGSVTFNSGANGFFTVTPTGSGDNNSTLMTIAGVMNFNSNSVMHLSVPAGLGNGTYTLASSSATPSGAPSSIPVLDSGSFASGSIGLITVDATNKKLLLTVSTSPTKLAFTSIPASGIAGTAFSITVQSQDAGGTPRNVNTNTTVALSLASGSGSLTGTLIGTIAAGSSSVTISTPVYSKSDTITLTATPTAGMTGLTAATSGSIAFTAGALDHLTISTISTPQTAGTAITGITITALDTNNNICASGPNAFTGTVTYTGTAGIAGTSAAFTAGQLTGVSLTPVTAGTGKTLIATGGGKSVTSTFDVNPGAISQLVMNPATIASATAGTAVSLTSITAKDSSGNFCSNGPNMFTGTVTFGGTAGVTGTSAAFTAGVLTTFPTLTPTTAGGSKTITATYNSVVGTTTITTVNPGPTSVGLSTVSAAPTTVVADGVAASTVTVTLKDAYNNSVPSRLVSLTQTSGPGSATITATQGTTDASGVATFTVKSTTAGTNVFTAQDFFAQTNLTQTVSVTFTPGTPTAAQSTVAASPTSVVADGSSTSTITVMLKDAHNNIVPGKSVTLAQTSGPGAPTITTTQGTTDASGVATFTVKSTTAGTDVFTATDSTDGITVTATASVTFNPGALDHFAISTISSPQQVGVAISIATITAQDANNNACSSGPNDFTGTVTFGGTAGVTGTSAAFSAGVLSAVSVTPTLAGSGLTFTVTASGKTGTATFDVNKGVGTVTLGNLSQTYDGSAKSASTTTAPGTYAVNVTYDGSPNAPTNAGSYAVVATISDNNYQGSTNDTLVIGKATSTISLTGSSFTYNGSAQTPTISFSGSTGLTTTNYVGTGATTYSSVDAPTNAGTYYVSNTVTADANYFGATNSLEFTIGTRPITITAQPNTKIYDGGTSATNVPTLTSGTLAAGDGFNSLTEAYSDPAVGTGKTVIPSATITNTATADVTANYAITANNDTTSVINLAQATTTLLLTNNIGTTNYYGQTLIFTAVVQTNSVTASDAGSNVVFSLGSTPVWTNGVTGGVAYYTNDDLTVGATNFTAQYLGDNNYLGSSVTITQTVLPATPTLTLTANAITYGQTLANSSLTSSTATNANNAADVTGSFAFAENTIAPNAGTTNVLVIFTPGDTTNYTTASNTVSVTVGQLGITVTATSGQSKMYGASDPTLTYTNTPLVGGDSFTGSLSRAAGENVGSSYVISQGTLTAGANYSITFIPANFAITPASTFVGATSTKNPSGYKDAISFIATLPTDATGSVVFSSTNGPISTNSVSSGSATSLSITNLPRGTNFITVAYLGDGNYVGSTNSFVQIVTNHPPVASVMLVTRTAGLSLKIALSDLATNWSDVDGDAVTLASLNLTTTNGVTLVQTNGWIYYTNAPNVADQISYTVSDGHGGTNTGYVNITVSFALVTGQTTGITVPDGNTAVVSFAGIPGYTYQVQRSTNLTDWVTISTTNAPTGGLFNYTDTFGDLGGNVPTSAYYRLGWTPSP